MTSLIRRKNNAVFSTANNKKEAKTGHFWMHLLATNNEFKKLSALLLLCILLLRFLLHCNTASIQYLQYNVLILRCFSATVSQKSERLCQSLQVKTKLFMFFYIRVRIQHVLASHDDIFSLYYVNIR